MFWRVCLINGAVFLVGTLVLLLAPVTVSARPLWSEVLLVSAGLLVIFEVNGLLLRSVLRPLDRLVRAMTAIDLRRPVGRLDEAGSGAARPLVGGFNAMVDRLEAERRTSTARALQAQEDERRRIAQELHDEVGQSLTAVLLSLKHAQVAAPPAIAGDLEQARETTRRSLEEVRRISQRLRPGVLDDLGLLNSLSSLASDLVERSGVTVRRGYLPGLPPLTPEVELVVYRVAQEALTNVVRHADARTVELGVSRRGPVLELRVADDGRGPAAGSLTRGAGVQGMEERARMVGGRLHVGSLEGGGTEVRLEVPVDGPPDPVGTGAR
ncbi:sensor histidine kinase [Nocardioides sp. HDW12B]|nr:sensor histidine kinase [Nocardioides sp. HDW12B]